MVKWKNKFHEKRALQKADALLSVSKFTADKTNEIFNIEGNLQLYPTLLMLLLLKE
jgi:hypothetical protein